MRITTEFGTGNFVVEQERTLGPRSAHVASTTLDQFWENEGKPEVRLVKIDVEGLEVEVLGH